MTKDEALKLASNPVELHQIKTVQPEQPPLPMQEPVAWCWIGRKGWTEYGPIPHDTYPSKPLYAATQPVQERNFCPRCGKRTADLAAIHTCTPPQENTFVPVDTQTTLALLVEIKRLIDVVGGSIKGQKEMNLITLDFERQNQLLQAWSKSVWDARAQPVQPQHTYTLQERLAQLHLYEEIAEHYAKCAISPEALRDWVAERADGLPLPVQPQRTWVGLTDEDITKINQGIYPTWKDEVQAVEAKLKEKNNGT